MKHLIRPALCAAVSAVFITACSQHDPDAPTPLDNPEVYQGANAPHRTETMEVVLQPGQATEIKAVMDEHQVIVYNWTVSGGFVYSDFHGHIPDDDSFWVRYHEQTTGQGSAGSLVAPFGGNHGWYYRNEGGNAVVIDLEVSGYFDGLVDMGQL